MIHNTSYSKFTFTPESQFGVENPKTSSSYKMPGSDIEIEKLVGKVNYASSMQSHKQGATKLFHEAYVSTAFGFDTSWMNGGRKAVLEDDFLYFFADSSSCSLVIQPFSTPIGKAVKPNPTEAMEDKPLSGYRSGINPEAPPIVCCSFQKKSKHAFASAFATSVNSGFLSHPVKAKIETKTIINIINNFFILCQSAFLLSS